MASPVAHLRKAVHWPSFCASAAKARSASIALWAGAGAAAVFAGCKANDACNELYPGIRTKFYKKVRELNRNPLMITIDDFQPEPVAFPIDGSGLLSDTASMIFPGDVFAPESIHDLLEVLWRFPGDWYNRPPLPK